MGFVATTHGCKKYVGFLNISFVAISCVFLIACFPDAPTKPTALNTHKPSNGNHCGGLKHLHDYKSKCFYLKSIHPCVDQGYVDYLSLLYCNFGEFPLLGQSLLFLWLLVLFYVLGDTASEYFCLSLENLSKALKLSPTIAGVTLLSLGNGAPDVFASLVSFMGRETSEVGLNMVVGGALVVTCVVVGIISISLHRNRVRIEKGAFLRDTCFLVLVIGSLSAILIHGKINLWGAIGFCSIYPVYVVVVYVTWKFGEGEASDSINGVGDLTVPILEKQELSLCVEEVPLLEDENPRENKDKRICSCGLGSSISRKIIFWVFELPLSLPRKLTIPVVSETRWSQPVFVISVTLSPVLLSILWNTQYDASSFTTTVIVYAVGATTGLVLGSIAAFSTNGSAPPKRLLCIWLMQGFVMSMTWSYVTAQELVALLVSLGYLFGVSPSVLGLTVLAWGNSLGDLITNLTMALHGGTEGAQVAVSGCYAGPIFNTVVGLGMSLVGSSWHAYPSCFSIQTNPYLLESLGLLLCGLVWALLVLTRKAMRLDAVLGCGLLSVYLVSMCLTLVQAISSL